MTGPLLCSGTLRTFEARVTGKEQFVCTSFGGMLAEIAWIGQYDSVVTNLALS